MRFIKYMMLVITVLLNSGCDQQADITSSKAYDHEIVRFSYPGNWSVSEERSDEAQMILFIESPGSGIFSITIVGLSGTITLEEYARSVSQAATTQWIKFKDNQFAKNDDQKIVSEKTGIKEKFIVTLLGEKLPHTREFYSRKNDNKKAFLFSQVADEDMEKVKPGFELILKTFQLK